MQPESERPALTSPMFPDLGAEIQGRARPPQHRDGTGSVSGDGASFTFIDLFAGIGGMRIGLTSVGGRCVYSCEVDRFARRTYETNFGPCEGSDIRTIDATAIPDHDVLAAGFPCQPFSIAGVSKKKSLGREHGFQDQASGNLFFEIVRVLEAKRPPAILLENVKNLRSHDRGNTFRVILSELDRIGYEVASDVIDAQAWVPQHRERTFIVGLRRDAYLGARFEFPPVPLVRPRPVLRDILEPSWADRYVLTDHLWSYLQGYREKHRAAGNGFGFGLVTGDDVARTLSARYHKDGSEILVDTGSRRPRRLTPVECGRLMGFPAPRVDREAPQLGASPHEPVKEFVVPVSDTQAYRQFGNAVVVQVVAHIGRALAEQAGFVAAETAVAV